MQRNTPYPLADVLSQTDAEMLFRRYGPVEEQALRGSTRISAKLRWINKNIRAVWTGEKRPPKAGEWYLSGSIIAAFQTYHDLHNPYHIAKLVMFETTIKVVEIES